MTMADQVAVMNGGRVEQLGNPADLYENPQTTFVANFLGTSHLIEAEVVETGTDVIVTAGGGKLRVPGDRCTSAVRQGGKVLVGVRPEKISLAHADDAGSIADGRNRVTGRIVDSSFIGVSTQYVVNSPAGAELQVYEQNIERDARLRPGAEVVLHWNPAHTFGLDAAQDIDAGVETVEDAG
jgi:spermidine/putrescine transport system ATP-binding protein